MKGEKFQAQDRSWSVQYLYLYESKGIIFMFDERKVKDFRGKKKFFFCFIHLACLHFTRTAWFLFQNPLILKKTQATQGTADGDIYKRNEI